MKNLLGFVQNYQQGGYVNPFDPTPTQQDVFNEYDIELTDDKYLPFLPTYDEMCQQFDVTNYIQNRQGLEAGGRSALSQLGQRSREIASQQGFVGTGKSLLDTTRSDIVDEFGRQSQRAWTGLQQDVYQRQRGFGEDMLSAIGDLPEDAYTMGEGGQGGSDDNNNNGVQLSYDDCMADCIESGGSSSSCRPACEQYQTEAQPVDTFDYDCYADCIESGGSSSGCRSQCGG